MSKRLAVCILRRVLILAYLPEFVLEAWTRIAQGMFEQFADMYIWGVHIRIVFKSV
jgi:hypothetical protein